MNSSTLAESGYLVELFREFYAELALWKTRARAGRGADAEQVFEGLRDYFLRKELDAGRRIDAEGSGLLFRDALYVMVVLADELLLNMSWPGRDAWRDSLLENEFFQTCIAGDAFFEKVDAYLKQRESSRVELGILYLYALALGFRGRYRDGDGEEPAEIGSYRRRLYVMIAGRKPELFEQDDLIPGVMAEAMDEGLPDHLPDVRRWLFIAGGVALAYLLISHAVWVAGTHELFRLTGCVLEPDSCAAITLPQPKHSD